MAELCEKKILKVCPVPLANEPQYSAFFTHGLLVAHAKAYKDGLLNRYCDFEKITPVKPSETESLIHKMKHESMPIVFMLASYVWNHDLNIAFAKRVRELIPSALIVIGGPNIPRAEKPCNRFMNINHCIDVAVQGEGEMTLSVLLEALCSYIAAGEKNIRQCDLSVVNGLTFRGKDLKPIRTANRDRIKDMNTIPSPYLTGEFEHLSVMPPVAVMETSRGCPFGCTFCDWGGATLSKIHRLDTQRIFDEIEYIAKKNIATILLADANFGTFDRDIEIAEKLVESKRKYGYPIQAAHFLAKNTPERVAKIVRILHSEKMMPDAVASLQSTDPEVLKNIRRSNIKESAYENLIAVFHEVKMAPTTDILVGLPGQTRDSFKRDLQFAFDRQVLVRCFPVRILPNSPMADEDYVRQHGLVVNESGFVLRGNSFTEEDCQAMLSLRVVTSFFFDEKVIFYLALYIQVEHGIPAIDLASRLVSLTDDKKSSFPALFWVKENMLNPSLWMEILALAWKKNSEIFFSNPKKLFFDILVVLKESFSIDVDEREYWALVDLQESLLVWPKRKVAPYCFATDYDFAGYFAQFDPVVFPVLSRKPDTFRPLAQFRRASFLEIKEQPSLHLKSFAFTKTELYSTTWTLDAGLAL
ncbi:MAG: radical SAM protein [Pseudomonadales bacterium]|jgi:radical SAM superfamily enzyme YgiQ (UPF0313 family)|nr:radical SAM protein [Pseudomonadales bacterium]